MRSPRRTADAGKLTCAAWDMLAAAHRGLVYATPTLPACYGTELAEALLDQVIDEQQTVSRAAECISPPPQESSPAYEGLRVNTTARARKQRGHGPDIEDKRATSADTHEQAAQHDTTLRSPPGRQHAPPAHDNRSSCATGLNTPVASRPPATLAPSRISPRAAPATEQLDRARPRSEPRRAPIFTHLGELRPALSPGLFADRNNPHRPTTYEGKIGHWIDAAGRPIPRDSPEKTIEAQADGIHSGESEIDESSSEE